MDLKGKILTRL